MTDHPTPEIPNALTARVYAKIDEMHHRLVREMCDRIERESDAGYRVLRDVIEHDGIRYVTIAAPFGVSASAPITLTTLATWVHLPPSHAMSDGPRLTPTEERVARLVAHGYDYTRIAVELHISHRTAEEHVAHIARKLPNPDHLRPYVLVLLWAAHRRWLAERTANEQPAA